MNGDGIYENGENINGCPYDYASTVVPIPHSNANERGVKANGTQSWNYSLKISNLKGQGHGFEGQASVEAMKKRSMFVL